MAWVEILQVEKSKYDSRKDVIYFDWYGAKKYSVLSKKSLEYLKVNKIEEGDYAFIMKSIGKNGNPYFITKMIKKQTKERGFVE